MTYTSSQVVSEVRVMYLTIWARTRDSHLLACVEKDLSRVAIRDEVVTVADVNRLRLTEVTSDINCASFNKNVTIITYHNKVTQL